MDDWTYSGDPAATTQDAVRFWLQDTDEARPLLSDPEISYVQSISDPLYGGSPIAAAALACRVIVSKFSSEAAISADGVSIDVGALTDKYVALQASLMATYNELAGMGAQPLVFGVDAFQVPDFGVIPPSFGKGFMDNPRAGSQEYGTYVGVHAEIPDSGYWTGS